MISGVFVEGLGALLELWGEASLSVAGAAEGLAVAVLAVAVLESSVVWRVWGAEDGEDFEQPKVSGKRESPRVRAIRDCGWRRGGALWVDFMEKRGEIEWEENEIV